MENKKLKTAVLGTNEEAQSIIDIASSLDLFDICAIAGADLEQSTKLAKKIDSCKPYDDYRQMIIASELDLLIVAQPIYVTAEHIQTAIKNKINIFKIWPGGRDFSEVDQLINLAKNNDIIFGVLNPADGLSSFQAAKDYINSDQLETPHLISIRWTTSSNNTDQTWQRDPELAGGGVLLYDAYQPIEFIKNIFGVPEQVYCIKITDAPDKQQRMYLAEDTAIAVIKFSESLTGHLMASRTLKPDEKIIKIYGKNKSITIEPDKFTTFDDKGDLLEEFEFCNHPQDTIKQALTNIYRKITSNDDTKINLIENCIETMAIIESCYLSARTSMPEICEKILQLGRVDS